MKLFPQHNDLKRFWRPGKIPVLIALILAAGTVFAAGQGEQKSINHLMAHLVFQLSIIIITARITGHIFQHYLKQPRVLGELVAGMIIGPYALGRIKIPGLDTALFPLFDNALPVSPELYALAVIASVILLFMAGLETDLPAFLRFSVAGTTIGLGGGILAFALGDISAVLCLPGVDSVLHPTALFLGTLSTATSIGITARILSDERKMSSPEGVTIIAAAVFDDIIGIILLAVVAGTAKARLTGETNWGGIGLIALKAFTFWLVCAGAGILLAPKLTGSLKKLKSSENFTGMTFGLALLLAGLSEMAGLAMIIGAYIVGISFSRTDIANELHARMEDVYQFFVPIFFCIMGMMVDFSALMSPLVLAFGLLYAALAIIAKMVGCGIPALLAGFNLRGAIRIGAGMLTRGEVALIIAGVGLSTGAIGPEMYGVAIMTLLITTFIAPPLLIKSFKGGTGIGEKLASKKDLDVTTIDLDFPSVMIADFVRSHIEQAFINEEFFVHRIDTRNPIYNIRKDDISITLTQSDEKLAISTQTRNEQLVRLIALEEVLELEELLESVKKMKRPDAIGTELMNSMFTSINDDA